MASIDKNYPYDKYVVIKFHYDNGDIETEFYYLNNKLHNENGPAVIKYLKNNKIISEQYWLNNKIYDKEMYSRMVKLLSFI